MTDTNRRHLIASTLAATTALAGCVSNGTTPDTVTLEIDTDDTWEGMIKVNDSTRKIAGRGSDRYEWTDEFPGPLHVSISKGPRTDAPLTITILADGEPQAEASTNTANDRIQVNYTP